MLRERGRYSGGSVSAEFGRERRFKGELLLASRRSRYRWHRRMAGGRCRKRVLHALDWCRAESSEDVLQQLVGGFVLTLHLVHGGFNGDDARAGEGIFRRSVFRGGGVQ